jgi:hypothetical protein
MTTKIEPNIILKTMFADVAKRRGPEFVSNLLSDYVCTMAKNIEMTVPEFIEMLQMAVVKYTQMNNGNDK